MTVCSSQAGTIQLEQEQTEKTEANESGHFWRSLTAPCLVTEMPSAKKL